MFAAILMLLLLALAVGALPAIGEPIGAAAATFADPAGYRAAVLTGASATGSAVDAGWHGEGIVLAILSTVAAVGIAVLSLYVKGPKVFRGPVSVLHRVHSGHVGDYAAWLVLGIALLAGIILVAG
jgi:multicomponent Na+:H+ antiporter subunit D